ncbi:hypothetical protein M2171_004739 [Bradyrhizobium japonicum USDA 38]|uniref:hypothetical protein n=1 Tax=Bradyrhizobium japonicum TaxID=375 RepID=UPI00067648F0|nr:hypothetical protein [Bradyrhizobium japonicum]MCS3895606.1 hypothetical protein [Bradyrhizobium japonicum USDA 38]MCS3948121.1 hypothetical protein [Bradyrhizobium japonicum]
MSPLEAIIGWVDKQDTEIQGEIAGCAGYFLFENDDVLALGGPEQVDALMQWLSEPDVPSYRAVGRAVRFRACFEYFAGSRFTESGWKHVEDSFRKIIAEATNDPNSKAARFAHNTQRMLNDLPVRKEKWRHVGNSWRELVQGHLSDDALHDWSLGEGMKSLQPEPITVTGTVIEPKS